MPKLSDASVKILDGAVVLFQRNRSSAWQMRFNVGSHWQRTTTKERELKTAKDIAQEIYLRARFKEQEGLPLITKRFSVVARHDRRDIRVIGLIRIVCSSKIMGL